MTGSSDTKDLSVLFLLLFSSLQSWEKVAWENGPALTWGTLQLPLGFGSGDIPWDLPRLRVLFWGMHTKWDLASDAKILWFLLNILLFLVGMLGRSLAWFGKQSGKLEMSNGVCQGVDKAGFLECVGRPVREPRFESVVSISVRVGQRWAAACSPAKCSCWAGHSWKTWVCQRLPVLCSTSFQKVSEDKGFISYCYQQFLALYLCWAGNKWIATSLFGWLGAGVGSENEMRPLGWDCREHVCMLTPQSFANPVLNLWK